MPFWQFLIFEKKPATAISACQSGSDSVQMLQKLERLFTLRTRAKPHRIAPDVVEFRTINHTGFSFETILIVFSDLRMTRHSMFRAGVFRIPDSGTFFPIVRVSESKRKFSRLCNIRDDNYARLIVSGVTVRTTTKSFTGKKNDEKENENGVSRIS
jgi:hypothetical protein